MNKYEEAIKRLNSLYNELGKEQYFEDLGIRFRRELAESIETITKLVETSPAPFDKQAEAKDYQEALDYLVGVTDSEIVFHDEIQGNKAVLQELIDREVPKEPTPLEPLRKQHTLAREAYREMYEKWGEDSVERPGCLNDVFYDLMDAVDTFLDTYEDN